MKKYIKIIENKNAIKASTQETRNKILSLLQTDNKTVPQIAEALNSDSSTIYRHVKKLEEHDLIKKVGERHEEGRPKHVYGRTAQIFLMLPEKENSEERFDTSIEGELDDPGMALIELQKLNEDIRVDNQMIEDFSILLKEIGDELVDKMDPIGFDLDNLDMMRIAFLLFLLEIKNNEEFKSKVEEFIE